MSTTNYGPIKELLMSTTNYGPIKELLMSTTNYGTKRIKPLKKAPKYTEVF